MANTTVKKNAKGYGYQYTDIAEIHEWLESQGYTYYQYIEPIDGSDYIITVPIIDGKEMPPRRGCKVIVATLSNKSNPAQEQGSGLTYARRYSLLMAFGLATTDDDAQCMTREKPKAESKVKSKEEEIAKQCISATKQKALSSKCEADGVDPVKIMEKFGIQDFSQLTERDFVWVCNNWTKEFKDAK